MTETPPVLEVFQELTIAGNPQQLEAVKAAILSAVRAAGPAWRPANDAEHGREQPSQDRIAVERRGDRVAPDAGVFLQRIDEGYRLTNIVPKETGELGRTRYNTILREFAERFARPAAAACGAKIETSAAEQTLDDALGEAGAKALRAFSLMANMSTGSSHPRDRDRWYAFIITVRDRQVDGNELGRWLRVLGWPQDAAWDLVSEFEFGRGLLDYMREA